MTQENVSKQPTAAELFILGDEKHQRAVSIIQALLNGKEPLEVAQAHNVSRQAVTGIRAKYVTPFI